MAAMLGAGAGRAKFFTEVAVPEGSTLIGRNVNEVDLFKRDGVRLIDVLRGDASLRRDMTGVELEAGDRVVLRTDMAEVLGLQQSKELKTVDKLSQVRTATVEVLITPGARMVGRTPRRSAPAPALRGLPAGRAPPEPEYRPPAGRPRGARGRHAAAGRRPGGYPAAGRRHGACRCLGPVRARLPPSKSPIAIAAMAGIVILAAFNVAPILALAVVAVAVVLLTGCIDADEAFSFVEGRLLALIFACSPWARRSITPARGCWWAPVAPALEGPAAGVPDLGGLFHHLGDDRTCVQQRHRGDHGTHRHRAGGGHGRRSAPLLVAVMIAASACFATPIGYQTNMLVYGPGGYRFTDFMRVGIPLNISLGVVVCLAIPLIFPL
jgi:hypothetical protein